MTINELVKELNKFVEEGLGDMQIVFKHYGDLPPLQEKELTRVVIGSGRAVLE